MSEYCLWRVNGAPPPCSHACAWHTQVHGTPSLFTHVIWQTFLATLHDEDVIITPYTHHSRPAGATSRHVGIGLSHKTLYQARSLVTPLSARCSALIKRDLGLGQMLSQLPSPPSLRILSYGRRSTRHAPLVSAEFEGVEESLKKLTLDERYDGGLYREYKLENEDVCIFIREDFTLDTIKVGE